MQKMYRLPDYLSCLLIKLSVCEVILYVDQLSSQKLHTYFRNGFISLNELRIFYYTPLLGEVK